MVVICFHPDRCIFCPYRTEETTTDILSAQKPLKNSSARFLVAIISFTRAVGWLTTTIAGSSRTLNLAPKHLVLFYLLHEGNL